MGNPKKNGRVDVWRASRRDNIYPEYTDIRERKKKKHFSDMLFESFGAQFLAPVRVSKYVLAIRARAFAA